MTTRAKKSQWYKGLMRSEHLEGGDRGERKRDREGERREGEGWCGGGERKGGGG